MDQIFNNDLKSDQSINDWLDWCKSNKLAAKKKTRINGFDLKDTEAADRPT